MNALRAWRWCDWWWVLWFCCWYGGIMLARSDRLNVDDEIPLVSLQEESIFSPLSSISTMSTTPKMSATITSPVIENALKFPITITTAYYPPPTLPPPPAKPIPIPDIIHLGIGFWSSFVTAFLIILISELGDKTFLIAAILAMRHSRLTVFLGAIGALTLMTIISSVFGMIVPNLIPRQFTVWIAALLFAIFGVKMLVEARSMSSNRMREEYDEINHEIEDSEERRRGGPRFNSTPVLSSPPLYAVQSMEAGRHPSNGLNQRASSCESCTRNGLFTNFWSRINGFVTQLIAPIFLQSFSLTFLAEWGDRSQIATIALAAAQNVYGVIAGATAGHGICTLLAVISGRLLASFLSIRTVTFLGGILFLLFSVLSVL